MTRGTEGYKVTKDIRLVLIYVVPAWVNVMYVKASSAWASCCAAGLAYFVASIDPLADALPIVPVLKASSAAPVGPVCANHMGPSALLRAILAVGGRWEGIKGLAAMLADQCDVWPNAASISAFSRTILDAGLRLVKLVSAEGTSKVALASLAPGEMAVAGAEDQPSVFASARRLPLECGAAMCAR